MVVKDLILEAEATQIKLSLLEKYFVELNKDEEMKQNVGLDGATQAENNVSMITLGAAYVAKLKADVDWYDDASDDYKKIVGSM
eukprot:1585728-Ditylum_brightwellii.AAC.1